jgi:hypothetical protein
MIVYKLEFEEMPDGTMRIHFQSPPSEKTTPKEQLIATAYTQHMKEILEKLGQNARFNIQTN